MFSLVDGEAVPIPILSFEVKVITVLFVKLLNMSKFCVCPVLPYVILPKPAVAPIKSNKAADTPGPFETTDKYAEAELFVIFVF